MVLGGVDVYVNWKYIIIYFFKCLFFQIFDITQGDISDLGSKFGLVHDKGTYDAISLNPDQPKSERNKYIEKVHEMLDNNGIFLFYY